MEIWKYALSTYGMRDSRRLIEEAFDGIRPERTPIFDIFTNDAVVQHFSGLALDGRDDELACVTAAGSALDGTGCTFVPMAEGSTWVDEAGNVFVASRWMSWIQRQALTDTAKWAEWMRCYIEEVESQAEPVLDEVSKEIAAQKAYNDRLNGTVFVHCTPPTPINELVCHYHCGLERFSYLWTDERELVVRWMRACEQKTLRYIQRTAHLDTSQMVKIYSDVAYKGRLMFGSETLNEFGFFDSVAQICDACHARGMQVIFHSDGYIMDIMDDLVSAGIDGLNPIEQAAGMDIYELRRKYPQLTMVGGVDVTWLLRTGSADEIRRETRRIIDEVGTEGRLLIGSSTEVDNTVPLENYLAFHDEVMKG